MTIKFACPHCARQVRTAAAAAGKKGKCPHCQSVIQIPRADSTAAAESVEFPCPECGQQVRTPANLAGKKGRCPRCAAVFTIPAKGAPATEAWSGLTPLDDRGGGSPLGTQQASTPQDDFGLQPLDVSPCVVR